MIVSNRLERRYNWLSGLWENPPSRWCQFDRNKPTVGKREASATPEDFARELIRLAEWSRG
jgi:hypothetical protein